MVLRGSKHQKPMRGVFTASRYCIPPPSQQRELVIANTKLNILLDFDALSQLIWLIVFHMECNKFSKKGGLFTAFK